MIHSSPDLLSAPHFRHNSEPWKRLCSYLCGRKRCFLHTFVTPEKTSAEGENSYYRCTGTRRYSSRTMPVIQPGFVSRLLRERATDICRSIHFTSALPYYFVPACRIARYWCEYAGGYSNTHRYSRLFGKIKWLSDWLINTEEHNPPDNRAPAVMAGVVF